MKKLTFVLLSLALAGFTASALAEKPADKGCGQPAEKAAGKPEKSTLLHCGCNWDSLDLIATMDYKEITISSRSKGHDAHGVGSVDSCYAGQIEIDVDVYEDNYVDFVRNGADCQLDGPELGDPIPLCADFDTVPVAGDPCGAEVID